MNHKDFPATVYLSTIKEWQEKLGILKTTKSRIAWARLGVIILLLAAVYILYPASILYPAIAALILIAVFIRLVILAVNNNAAIDNANRIMAINQREIDIAAGHYTQLPAGEGLATPTHDYANDLDIFGRASLFQYINRTTSEPGQDRLVSWLLQPGTTEIIEQRQAAAKELAGYYQWRQQLQSFGMADRIQRGTNAKLVNWSQEKNTFITHAYWQWLRFLLPAIILTATFLYLDDIIPAGILAIVVAVFLAVSSLVSRKITPVYKQLNKIIGEINTLYNSIACIEQQNFKADTLKKQQAVFTHDGTKASAAVRSLKLVLDRLDFRVNPMVFIPVNTFFLWDLQQIIALENWKEKHKAWIPHWIDMLAELEALCTLGNLHFNHPGWSFPVIDKNEGTLEAVALGHPLIPENKMVLNDFSTRGTAQVALVTGSNMAGKSTFLRSLGVNIVLAMMGAPVYAASMRVAPMRVVSSMRVADNLEESTSTFYAELKKLKSIIEYVNRHEHVFVLLDEILRGTNSLDRHTGSKALVKQLIRKNAVAILATHDVELAKLQDDYPASIHNYHFDAQIANEELYFDYKLKEGICQSINASILMKKIGIEL